MNNMNLFQQQQQQHLYRKKCIPKEDCGNDLFSIYTMNDWWKNARAKIITFSDLCVVEIDFY